MTNTHSFDIEVATALGVEKAILLDFIGYWCNKNRANGQNLHDSKAWTYNSYNAFSELFPYLKNNTIKRCLRELETDGYIESRADLNTSKWDKTKWYTRTHKEVILDSGENNAREDLKQRSIKNESNALYNEQFKHSSNTVQTQFLEDWNNFAKIHGLKSIKKLTKERRAKLRERLKVGDLEEDFKESLQVIQNSPFLLGNNDRGWKVDFDWLIKNDTNLIKVLEGKYTGSASSSSIVDDYYEQKEKEIFEVEIC